MAQRAARKQTVACLVEIEKKFNDAADMLSTYHSMELRKALVGLRKEAVESKLIKKDGDKILITKELFDSHMADVLAPRVPELSSDIRGLAEEARKSHEGLNLASDHGEGLSTIADSIFSSEESQALAKAAEIKQEFNEKADVEFTEWKIRKRTQATNAVEIAKAKALAEEQEKKQKQKKANKAYKQWCKLRTQGKYVSKVDKKVHILPETHRADHDGKWSKDIEVVHPEVSYL